MADVKKYVSLDKLGKYDAKIKSLIDTKDEATLAAANAYADGLASNYEAAGTVATAKTELEGKIATAQAAAEAADGKAVAAQGEVDALELVVGTLPEGETSVVAYIEKKTAGIATDAALAELQGKVTQAEKDIDAIEADYLKAADKEAVEALITAEATTARAAEKANADAIDVIEADYLKAADKAELAGDIADAVAVIEAVKEDVDAFFLDADMTESAKDTLKELQQYIASDESGASQMAASIKQNADDIDALEGRMDTAEGAIDAVEGRMDTAESEIDALQALFGEGDGTVADMIADAVAAEAALRVAGDEAAEAAAGGALSAAQAAQAAAEAAQGAADAAQGEVDALEGVVAGKAAQADLTALAERVTTAEGEIDTLQSEMDAVEGVAAGAAQAAADNAAAIALKAEKSALEAEIARAKAAEEANAAAIAAFVEVSEEEINALFPTA